MTDRNADMRHILSQVQTLTGGTVQEGRSNDGYDVQEGPGWDAPTREHPGILYHSTPLKNRDSILQHGLSVTFTDGAGIFFTDTPSSHPGLDCWAVNVAGIPLERDATTNHHHLGEEWWVTYDHETIPPNLLTRTGTQNESATRKPMREFINLVTTLTESVFYRGPIETEYYADAVEIVVLKNPSHTEMMALLQASDRKALRATVDGSDLFAWDSNLAIHSDIRGTFGVEGVEVTLYADHVSINKESGEPTEAELKAMIHAVTASRAVARAYGAVPQVTLD